MSLALLFCFISEDCRAGDSMRLAAGVSAPLRAKAAAKAGEWKHYRLNTFNVHMSSAPCTGAAIDY